MHIYSCGACLVWSWRCNPKQYVQRTNSMRLHSSPCLVLGETHGDELFQRSHPNIQYPNPPLLPVLQEKRRTKRAAYRYIPPHVALRENRKGKGGHQTGTPMFTVSILAMGPYHALLCCIPHPSSLGFRCVLSSSPAAAVCTCATTAAAEIPRG